MREEFSDFVQCSCETNGEVLSNILSTLTSNGLDLQLMGGRDMTELVLPRPLLVCIKGVATRIQSQFH